MSLVAEITKVIREVLMDGKVHSLSEIKAKIEKQNVKIKKGSSALRSTIYKMKQRGEIVALEPGVYRLEQSRIAMLDEQKIFSVQELQKILPRLKSTMQTLKNFNWMQCSEIELNEAREKAMLLENMSIQLREIWK